MRAFILIYWLLGLVAVGSAIANELTACPARWHSKLDQNAVVALVGMTAIWPALLLGVSLAPHDGVTHSCGAT